jgi:GNAT superfamily N-acetyltransferase
MTDTFLIRTANAGDIDAVDALLARSYPALLKGSYAPSVYVTAIPLISKAQPRLLACGSYFLVMKGEQVVGAGGWTRATPGGAGEAARSVGHVRHVVTDHRHVRQGIGRRLMSHVFETAEAVGIRQLECFSTLMAEPFYASVGFETLGPMSVNLWDGVELPAVHMRRAL